MMYSLMKIIIEIIQTMEMITMIMMIVKKYNSDYVIIILVPTMGVELWSACDDVPWLICRTYVWWYIPQSMHNEYSTAYRSGKSMISMISIIEIIDCPWVICCEIFITPGQSLPATDTIRPNPAYIQPGYPSSGRLAVHREYSTCVHWSHWVNLLLIRLQFH